MDTTPKGLQQLLSASEITIDQQMACCKNVYSVSAPNAGPMFTTHGLYNYRLRDTDDKIVIEMRHSRRFLHNPAMEIRVCGGPPIIVKRKSGLTATLIIREENGTNLLKIKIPIQLALHPVYEIWSVNAEGGSNTQIGMIEEGFLKHKLKFPADLDVRCKAALLGACIFTDIMRAK